MQVVIESLYKQYGKVEALRDVNLQIESGMFGLLGPNGAGKTTLMRILATLIPKSAGKVRIGPYDLDTEPHKVRELLGYLPQSFNTYRNFTAFEVLDYVAVLKGITDTKAPPCGRPGAGASESLAECEGEGRHLLGRDEAEIRYRPGPIGQSQAAHRR